MSFFKTKINDRNYLGTYALKLCDNIVSDMLHGFGMCTADYKVTQLSKKIHNLPTYLPT